MNVLQLVSRVPYPLNSGGSIHSYLTARGLAKAGITLTMLAVDTPKHPTDIPHIERKLASEGIRLETVKIDTSITIPGAISNLFSNRSYHISRFDNIHFRNHLEDLLKAKEWDIVQFEGIFLLPYLDSIRKYSKAKLVLKAHNVEHLIWQRLKEQSSNIFTRWYLNLQIKRLKKFELLHINRVDGLVSISPIDLSFFELNGCKVPSAVVPAGIENEWIENIEPINNAKRFFFIGSMDWLPNKEGVEWLLNKVWPNVIAKRPNLVLNIAGKKMETRWARKHSLKGVIASGEVKDAKNFILNNNVLLVPLFSGSGIRIKILEALSLGRAVISTSLGAEGLELEKNKDLIIANTAKEFEQAIIQLAEDSGRAKRIALHGKNTVMEKYNNNRFIQKLIGFYDEIIEAVN